MEALHNESKVCGVNVRHEDRWLFDYRGVTVEVVSRPAYEIFTGAATMWTYYVHAREQMFQADDVPSVFIPPNGKMKHYPYEYMRSAWADVDFHGGVTFYNIVNCVPDRRVVKVGCDYGHLWDRECHYTLESVVGDAKRTVDSMHELFALNVYDWKVGGWHAPDTDRARELIAERDAAISRKDGE